MSWVTTDLSGPRGLAIDTINNYIYCANNGSNSITQISLTNPPVIVGVWATGISAPRGLAIKGGFIYCANNGLNTITKISLTNPPVVSSGWATTGDGPQDLAIDGDYIYSANLRDDTISKISLTNPLDVTLSWATGNGPIGLAIDSVNQYIYVSNNNNNTISKISLTDPQIITNDWVITNGIPRYLEIDSEYLYCAIVNLNTISKISLTNPSTDNNPNWAITGSQPYGLAINNGFIYESNPPDSSIWKISLTTPCFNKGTKILCLNSIMEEEYIPIEDLKKGDLVKSYLHGYRKIDSIGNNTMINNPEHFNLSMYKMEKTDSNGLTDDLIVTGGHSILVDDLGEYYSENQVKFKGKIPKIDDKIFLLSAVSKDFTQLTDTNEYTYYHLCLENNGNNDERFGIWANGILTETISKNQFTEIEQILHF
jgi:hypothetical protein